MAVFYSFYCQRQGIILLTLYIFYKKHAINVMIAIPPNLKIAHLLTLFPRKTPQGSRLLFFVSQLFTPLVNFNQDLQKN